MLAHGKMGHWINLYGGLIELCLVPASAPRLVLPRLWCVLSSLWDGAYKRAITAKSSPSSSGSRFPLSLSEWSFTICLTPYNSITNILSA